MDSFAPTILVLAINLDDFHLFKQPARQPTGPYLSSVLFMLAAAIILNVAELRPTWLREIWGCGTVFMQFLVMEFLFEHIMADFWYPVDDGVACLLTMLIESLEQSEQGEYFRHIIDLLKCDTLNIISSYMLSTFFLVAALHSSKLIDLRLLSRGVSYFIADIKERAQKSFKSLTAKELQSCMKKPVKECPVSCPKYEDTSCDDTKCGESQKKKKAKKKCS